VALTNEQIFVGSIAYFSVDILKGDPFTRKGGVDHIAPGAVRPFVCYDSSEAESCWAPITSTYRSERVEVRALDRENMPGPTMYLNDGTSSVKGSNDAFIQAAAGYDQKNDRTRPRIRNPKIFEIIAEIEKRGGLQLG
jgi:hypothetical protein